MQEELIKVLSSTTSSNNLKKFSLIQANLKCDFFSKLNQNLASVSKQAITNKQQPKQIFVVSFMKSINFSRNQIEDRGISLFINCLLSQQQTISNTSNLKEIYLSKCSLTSKSINQMFTIINFTSSLTILDLSYNNLKEDPVV